MLKCFKFTFAFGTGLTAFGGLITSIQLIVKITTKSGFIAEFVTMLFIGSFPTVALSLFYWPSLAFSYQSLQVCTCTCIIFILLIRNIIILFDVVRFEINVTIVVASLWIPWFLVTERIETDEERGGNTAEQDNDQQLQDTGIRQSLTTAVTDYGSTN